LRIPSGIELRGVGDKKATAVDGVISQRHVYSTRNPVKKDEGEIL